MALVITGILWAMTDMLLVTVLVESPVSPISVLFMLYGLFGSLITEVLARWLGRGNENPEKK